MARSVIIGVGAVLVIIGVGAVWWYFQPKPPPSHQSPPPVVTEQIEDLQTEALQNQIEALQRQIDAIQAEIGKTPVLSLITKLENVQRQLEEIQGQKTAYQTQLDELQTRIESIYNQLVENLTQEIEHIQAQIGTDTILSLATKLDSVQKQMKAIQSANAQRPKTDQVIALNKRIEVRQTHIEQIYTQLVENLSQEIDRIQAKIDTNTILDLATNGLFLNILNLFINFINQLSVNLFYLCL
jgi:chromosome segregation ATPase